MHDVCVRLIIIFVCAYEIKSTRQIAPKKQKKTASERNQIS